MAAPGENLLSVERLTSMDQNTFTKQRELFIKKSRGMQLQQRLQELKERERRAQQHNRQLLLQFERAQETLKEMLACNAAMKTIRMEYERYLEEKLPCWQQQLQEKTEASHKKRMEDCLKSYLQQSKDQVSTATLDEPLISQDPSMKALKVDAPQTFPTEGSSAYSRDRSSCYPHQESSWLTQAGMPPGFLQTPFQSQSPSPFPPPSSPYPHPPLLQHLTYPSDHRQLWVRSEAVGRPPERYSHPCSDGIAVGSAGQLHTHDPPASSVSRIVERETETSAADSKRVRGGGGGRCLSSELDIKPVRLSSGHVESSESGRDSSLTSREKKKREKKGRTEASSSESERSGSQRTSRTSSEVVAASCAVALDSETNCSSVEGSTTSRRSERGQGVNTGSPPSEKEAEELSRSEEEEQTDSLSEQTRSPTQDNKSGSCRGDDDLAKSQNSDDEEVYSSEQSVAEEKDEEERKKNQSCGDEETEKEVKSKEGGDVEEDDEESNDEVPSNRNQKEDKDVEEDKDQSEKLENEDRDDREKDSDSSQDEDEEEREGSERIEEEEEESSEEEDQPRSEEAGDSEDSIICPQENRSKQMKNIPEEAAEDEGEGSDTRSSDNKSKEPSDEEDIENLLAPQKPINKKQNAVKTKEKPKATCLNLGIFQVTEDRAKTGHKSDSDESDHFYD
ncbi:protein starmaker-like isoform X1 [Gambusia affinis]|uniref:protein starmaker-like isoform X1 n=1 Tax=Gambusia affinis TaxID=33528 RepID=UPI001CDD1013|nr:protein starmaker-like isoform X1 [Gambusia affinis]